MKYFIFLGMLYGHVHLLACDLCGGVGSNASIGIFAANRFHLVGWRQNLRLMDSYLYGIKHSSEFIWQSDLNVRTQLGKRVQFYGTLPIQLARQKTDFQTAIVSGISDPSVMFTFALMDRKDSMQVTHDFWNVGLGVKFPCGKWLSYHNSFKNLAPSTGSFDGMLLSNYTHRFKNALSFQAEGSYAIKGKDPDGYQFGPSTQLSSSFIYNQKVQGIRLISSLGVQWDQFQSSRLNGARLMDQNMGGTIFSLKGSLNLLMNRYLVSAQFQVPMYQQLNLGSTKQKIVFGLHIYYLIQKIQHEK